MRDTNIKHPKLFFQQLLADTDQRMPGSPDAKQGGPAMPETKKAGKFGNDMDGDGDLPSGPLPETKKAGKFGNDMDGDSDFQIRPLTGQSRAMGAQPQITQKVAMAAAEKLSKLAEGMAGKDGNLALGAGLEKLKHGMQPAALAAAMRKAAPEVFNQLRTINSFLGQSQRSGKDPGDVVFALILQGFILDALNPGLGKDAKKADAYVAKFMTATEVLPPA